MTRISLLPLPLSLITGMFALGACSSAPELRTVDHVDIQRFMGRWYVIASIPTFLEKDAYNAVETYELDDDGSIATTFTFRKGSFNGELKEFTPRGFVDDDPSNAVWGMRFIWPIKADYRIVHLAPDYSTTIIARNKLDYVWIMAREPQIPDVEYERLVEFVGDIGYDPADLVKVPQKW